VSVQLADFPDPHIVLTNASYKNIFYTGKWTLEWKKALIFFHSFFRLLLFFFSFFFGLNWQIYCDDHSSLSSTTAVQI